MAAAAAASSISSEKGSSSSSSSLITAKKRLGASGKSFRLRSSRSLNSVRLRRIFDLFDKNGDGMITVEELSQALSLLGLEAEESELESTIKTHIRPGNIGLDYQDFAALHDSLDCAMLEGVEEEEEEDDLVQKEEQEERDLTEAFKVFDEDGDGYISAHELQVVLDKLGLPEAREMDRVHQMIHTVDLNRDGLVDFFEFKDMMRTVLVPSS